LIVGWIADTGTAAAEPAPPRAVAQIEAQASAEALDELCW
jgi:hypothetical protein